jgi:outer membrane lipoprotein LolB
MVLNLNSLRRRSAAPALALALLALSGCTAFSPVTLPSTEQARATRSYHDAIDISGRLSVRYQQPDEQLITGSFNWSQRPNHLTVTLLSPFGQAVARIEVEPGRATFQRSGQPLQTATDVDQLAAQALGWPLPVSGLQAWLQGFASVRGNAVAASSEGPTAITSADGWRISYAAWSPEGAGSGTRPRRIDLARRTEQAGEVEMRIVVDSWQPLLKPQDQ